MSKRAAYLMLAFIVFISSTLAGCNTVESLKVKYNLKNLDFEYIKQGKIKKVIIQNSRDKGFRFLVSDTRAINELYDILSTAKVSETKTTLKPDYTFELQESAQKVYKLQYVAGLDNTTAGNLYTEDGKFYIVSKRMDNDIIKNFWNLRKPREFKDVYYGSLLETLQNFTKLSGNESKSIGIDIDHDEEAAKFIFSTDLEAFNGQLSKNEEILDSKRKYDVVMKVQTQGYKNSILKVIVTFTDKNNDESKYYVFDEYKNDKWNISITTDKPKNF